MRFIQTSDWHLGRLFHGVHLTEDQAHVLDQLVDLAKESDVDALVVAGDIYDRAVPPPDAVTLLDEVLTRVVVDLDVPVLMIAGNHDSPERVAFGSRLLSQRKIHVAGTLSARTESVVITDEHGPVHFHLIPYAEPAVMREKLSDENAVDHSSGMRIILDNLRQSHQTGQRSVVVAHAFVAGGQESESERPLSVGGSGAVDAHLFAGFDYVALGHLHRAQQAGAPSINYCGSLLKYSFAEAEHEKRVNLVEMDSSGKTRIEKIALSPRRDVRRIEGFLSEILSDTSGGGSRDDYLEVTLLDNGAILDPLGKLRERYPNVLHLRRLEFLPDSASVEKRADHRRISDFDLFKSFFKNVTGEDMTEGETDSYRKVVEGFRAAQREVLI